MSLKMLNHTLKIKWFCSEALTNERSLITPGVQVKIQGALGRNN